MTLADAMAKLESYGTAQNRKVYGRHGVGPAMFGVSYANLNKLRKAIRIDHELALGLWESGVHDARVLATMVADPRQATSKQLDAWSKDLDNGVLADAFARYAAQTEFAEKKIAQWTKSRSEWVSCAGWVMLAWRAMNFDDTTDAYFRPYLRAIRTEIHQRPNRTRYAMNGALIAIGCRSEKLRDAALKAATSIGRVEVDHGETGCKTPDAARYIDKAWARRGAAATPRK